MTWFATKQTISSHSGADQEEGLRSTQQQDSSEHSDMSETHSSLNAGQCSNQFTSRDKYDAWTHALKSVLSSHADVIGGWVYFFQNWKNSSLHRFVIGQLIICIVSTLSFFAVVIMECLRLFDPEIQTLFNIRLKYVNAFEIVFEDIPQIILSAWIQFDQKGLSPEGVFNLTTSLYNSFQGLVDLMRPDELPAALQQGQEAVQEQGLPQNQD